MYPVERKSTAYVLAYEAYESARRHFRILAKQDAPEALKIKAAADVVAARDAFFAAGGSVQDQLAILHQVNFNEVYK